MITLIIIISLGISLSLLIGYVHSRLRNRSKALYQRALERYQYWEQTLLGYFDSVPGLIDRTAVIKQSSGFYHGRTAVAVEELIHQIDHVHLVATSTRMHMDKIDQLIEPYTVRARLSNRFVGSNYSQALRMMEVKSIGFTNRSDLGPALNSNEHPEDYGELLGSEDQQEPFLHSLTHVTESYAPTIESLHRQVETLEEGIHGVPRLLEESGTALGEILKRLSWLSQESHFDGFFPLNALRNKLIPSAEAIIDDTAEVGLLDPIAAFESPAIKARRQIEDANRISLLVKTIRRKHFPSIRTAVQTMEGNLISPEWVNREFEELSANLESICSHAVLWPIDEQLATFQNKLDATLSRMRTATQLSDQIRNRTVPLINQTEKKIATSRRQLGNTLNLEPERVMREGDLDPSQRVSQARASLPLISESISRGHTLAAEEALLGIESMMTEAEQLTEVGSAVIEHADTTWSKLSSQLESLRQRFPKYRSSLEDMLNNGPSELLDYNDRFGNLLITRNAINTDPNTAKDHLKNADLLLNLSRDSLDRGELLATGRLLEQAADEVRVAELQMSALSEQCEALVQADSEYHKIHQANRFHFRTIEPRLADRRTRHRTLLDYHRLEERLTDCDQTLDSENPFKARLEVRQIEQDIRSLEESIAVDWEWHELATDSVKIASRALRKSRAKFGEWVLIDPTHSKPTTKNYAAIKQQLQLWQDFLEDEHLNWEEAFHGSVKIDIESAQALADNTGDSTDCRQAGEQLANAARTLSKLTEWSNVYQVAVDREAGDQLFEQARVGLYNGNYKRAYTNARAATEHIKSAISHANALTHRARIVQETQERSAAEMFLNQSKVTLNDGAQTGTIKLTTSLTAPIRLASNSSNLGFRNQPQLTNRPSEPARAKSPVKATGMATSPDDTKQGLNFTERVAQRHEIFHPNKDRLSPKTDKAG